MIDLKCDIDELSEDERGEGDGDDLVDGLVKEEHGEHHDHAALVHALQHPREECLERQRSTLSRTCQLGDVDRIKENKRQRSIKLINTLEGEWDLLEFAVEFRELESDLLGHVHVEHEGEHGRSRVPRRVAHHQPSLTRR